jgi:lipocalin
MYTFERNAVCVTADYDKQDDGTIRVRNSQRVKSPDGKVKNIEGNATQPNPEDPGKLGRSTVTGVPLGCVRILFCSALKLATSLPVLR